MAAGGGESIDYGVARGGGGDKEGGKKSSNEVTGDGVETDEGENEDG